MHLISLIWVILKNRKLSISVLVSPGNSQVSFESPTFYRLDTQALTEAIQKLKNNL